MMPAQFPPPPAHDDVDVMVGRMKRANRAPIFAALALVAGAATLAGLVVLRGRAAAASELKHRGYSATQLTMRGPFTWGFSGTKGTAECGGSIEKIFFSTSIEESCFDVKPAPRSAPARPANELLQEGLRKQFAEIAVTSVRCPSIDPGAVTATCTAAADAGEPIDVVVEKANGDWTIRTPEQVILRPTLSAGLTNELRAKAKKGVFVDCGAGLFGYSAGDELTCVAGRKGAKKPGRMTVVFKADGSYTWTATGI